MDNKNISFFFSFQNMFFFFEYKNILVCGLNLFNFIAIFLDFQTKNETYLINELEQQNCFLFT